MQTPERASEAVLRAVGHWNARHEGTAPSADIKPFTIALGRDAGARGTAIAREVGRRLNWEVYDQELVELIARELKTRPHLLESVDEHHVSWLREVAAGFSQTPVVSESAYVQQVVERVLSLGTHGHCVIVGRGSAFILPGTRTLRVRLTAPLADRIAMMAADMGLSAHDAEQQIRKTDHDRRWFIREYFRKDPEDPTLFDLTLNSGRFRVDECADLIVAALHRLQGRLAGG